MTEPVESLSERVVRHTQSRSDFRTRWRIGFVCNNSFRESNRKRIARRAVLLL